MTQEKREINPGLIIRGVLSFLRAGTITNSSMVLHGAFKKLKDSGFPLLQNILFGSDDQSRQIEEKFSALYRTGVIRYSGAKYELDRKILWSLREDLPKHFTADEIIQLSEIAERLEDMLKVEV